MFRNPSASPFCAGRRGAAGEPRSFSLEKVKRIHAHSAAPDFSGRHEGGFDVLFGDYHVRWIGRLVKGEITRHPVRRGDDDLHGAPEPDHGLSVSEAMGANDFYRASTVNAEENNKAERIASWYNKKEA